MGAGVPPTRPQQSQPSGEGDSSSDKVQSGKSQKKFALPKKTDQEGGQKGKEALMEAAQQQQAIKGQIGEGQLSEEITASGQVGQAQAAASLSSISELILQKAATLSVDGKNTAIIGLRGASDVPEYLANTSLTLTMTPDGLKINITNFESRSQQQSAILNIQQKTEQLQLLVNNLATKGIQLTELQIGTSTINLPTPQAVTPIEPPPISAEAQREEGRRGGEEEGGGGPQGGPE